MSDSMDKLADWMGASSGEELRILHDNLKLYESLLFTALEAMERYAEPYSSHNKRAALLETVASIRSKLEKDTNRTQIEPATVSGPADRVAITRWGKDTTDGE